MDKIFIIKIGGNVLDNEHALRKFLHDFSAIREPKILVHGGGKIASRIGEQLGITAQYEHGRRITDAPTRDLVTMVYGGLVNKQIVAALQEMGCNALGLTGADGNAIKAVKRQVKETDFGFVGDINHESVNTVWLKALVLQHVIPVFAPLTHSKGQILNTNADTIASVLAVAMSRHFHVRLIYCFEKKGVLMDVDDATSVIQHLTKNRYRELLQLKKLVDGILPKLENAYDAIQAGVDEVLIGEAGDLIKNTGEETEGTLITA